MPRIPSAIRCLTCALGLLAAQACFAVTELRIATVSNRQMIQMQELGHVFEKDNPDIRLEWQTMEEGALRRSVAQSVESGNASFDVVTIGMYETSIWAERGWLKEIQVDKAYDVKDLIPTVRAGLSLGSRLFAAPFYGEGSLTAYRTDLFAKAGIPPLNSRPTWTHIREAAAKIHKPSEGVFGICLRGLGGWGANMALVSTMVNTFGGQWFNVQWEPQINTPAWRNAVSFYVELLRSYGPPSASENNFNENLDLFRKGQCGIWVDASSAAGALVNPKVSKVANATEFALAPTQLSEKGAGWLWSWALAIPSGTSHEAAAQRFVQWATSQEYVALVAKTSGPINVPSGTRLSTYRSKEFLKVARFAMLESIAMVTANPRDATEQRSPYLGIQFVAIPEFMEIGDRTGAEVSEALRGRQTVEQALSKAQAAVEIIMNNRKTARSQRKN